MGSGLAASLRPGMTFIHRRLRLREMAEDHLQQAFDIDRAGLFEQCRVQIAPVWVQFLDQPNFPIPTPLLELLFARNCVYRIVIALEPDQAIDAVSSSEARYV